MSEEIKRIGLDVGSTTVKCAVLDGDNNILYSDYRRHLSKIPEMTSEMLFDIAKKFPHEQMKLTISGSAGMGMANDLGLPFVQEVYATRSAVLSVFPETDAVIELGGEDAKILFLSGGLEVRMNGSCAGGTGAFIDQMATLMNITPDQMDGLAEKKEKIYTIASRCGVFAKSDIQPLINQGARREDICASILYAVVNQTVAGLAQGRKIEGNVLYLGGPLTFFPQLRKSFDDVLKIEGNCPENSLYFVAMGAAMSQTARPFDISEVAKKALVYKSSQGYSGCRRLFECEAEYDEFVVRHEADSENIKTLDAPSGEMFLGIDAGSTTVKAVLCDRSGNIFRTLYTSNSGNPVPIIKDYLEKLYRDFPDIIIAGSAVTGYGEEIIKNAFNLDMGIVETVAHYTAAAKFRPDVDFIIDIGGQDIKCFKIRNGAVDNIFLNEACSSGCGSFLQTFAGALGYDMRDFARLGLFAEKPVDLGSRCTVFMNSSVKQAQKDGASVENISAGLSVSVVKNALYKVIRCVDPDLLGRSIVVQGGTFLSDAVLRAFEQEIGKNVIRPSISGLMGAYGAALYAEKHTGAGAKSGVYGAEALEKFTHEVKAITCRGCSNNCKLTVNTFDGKRKFIAGNRCEKPLGVDVKTEKYNLYEYKNKLLEKYNDTELDPNARTIGIPMGLNMYELLPFWYTLFKKLGFNVINSGMSTRKLYVLGQQTIPSDTVCYPAKLLHGHIARLCEAGPDAIFYPSMSYNVEEGRGDNHFNCPVVAYYPKVIAANVKIDDSIKYISGFIGIHDKKEFAPHFARLMAEHFGEIPISDIKTAAEAAYAEYYCFMEAVKAKALEYIDVARRKNMPVIVLAGRPYHIDSEINHGIDGLICDLGAVVITEDSICDLWLGDNGLRKKQRTTVLNQWTYHSRLYSAAKYVASEKNYNINLVQLVSFGCGVDAVTTDETRSIIEQGGKIYTQIKIDEISNMGAVKIRLRSLFSTLKH